MCDPLDLLHTIQCEHPKPAQHIYIYVWKIELMHVWPCHMQKII
jgi:hypothetical protein